VIARAFQVLEAFRHEKNRLTLTDLTKLTGMPKGTVQRILFTLQKEGYLIKSEEDKTYKLSMKFFQLASVALKELDVIPISRPHLKRIRDQTGECVYLNIIHEDERMCVDFFAGHHELQAYVHIGQRSPLYAGASAKALLAFLPDEEIERILNGKTIEKITPNTITDKREIWQEIVKIREKGFAVSQAERIEGIVSISFPIFNYANDVVASISMMIPTARAKKETLPDYIRQLGQAAKTISNELGFSRSC
jgi:DNA-binding IclR family transcriptional regulator